MELNAFWAAVLRRWYLVLVGVAASVAVTVAMVNRIGPTYEAEGAVLLFPPSTTVVRGTTAETQGNPYLMLGGLNLARDIVIRALSSKSAQDQFEKQEPDASYEAGPDFTTSSPIIVITVEAPTSDAAVRGLARVLDRIPKTLVALQSDLGLADSAYITARELTADAKPEIVRKGQIRGGIVAGAGAFALSLLLLGLLDGLLSARKARQLPGRRARVSPTEAAAGILPGSAGAPVAGPRQRAPEPTTRRNRVSAGR